MRITQIEARDLNQLDLVIERCFRTKVFESDEIVGG